MNRWVWVAAGTVSLAWIAVCAVGAWIMVRGQRGSNPINTTDHGVLA